MDVARIVVLIAGVSLAVSFTSAVSGGILTGMQRFDISNQIGIATLIVRTIVIVVMILMGYGLVALALTHFAMQVLAWTAINWYARKIRPDIEVRLRDANKESAKELQKQGLARKPKA